jgi:hypothetical protein
LAIKYPSLLDCWIEGKLTAENSTFTKYKKTDSSGFSANSAADAARFAACAEPLARLPDMSGCGAVIASKRCAAPHSSIKRRMDSYKKTDRKV